MYNLLYTLYINIYIYLHIYTYMHVPKLILKGHGFEREHGGIERKIWREEEEWEKMILF